MFTSAAVSLGLPILLYSVLQGHWTKTSPTPTDFNYTLLTSQRWKRQIAWDFAESKPRGEVVLPSCPCHMESNRCTDVNYCYCHLEYPPPFSVLTGESLLKGFQCLRNDSKLTVSFLQKNFALFHDIEWECEERQDSLYQRQSLHASICVQDRRLPLTGSFFVPPPDWVLDSLKNLSRMEQRPVADSDGFWYPPNNSLRPTLCPTTPKKSFGTGRSSERLRAQRTPGIVGNGDKYVISGGPWCFERLSVYRSRTAFEYACTVNFHRKPSVTPSCDRIRSLLLAASQHLFNIQLKDIFQLDSNRTVSFVEGNGDEGFKPKVTQRTVTRVQRSKDDACSNQVIGLQFKFVHHRFELLTAQFIESVGLQPLHATRFEIQMRFQSEDVDLKYFSKLSRFWYEFYHAICYRDSCWRGMFEFTLQEDFECWTGILIVGSISFLGILVSSLLNENF